MAGRSTSSAPVRSYDATRLRRVRAGSRSHAPKVHGTAYSRLAASDSSRAWQDHEARAAHGTVTVLLCSRPNASPFWIMLLLFWGRLDHGIIRICLRD